MNHKKRETLSLIGIIAAGILLSAAALWLTLGRTTTYSVTAQVQRLYPEQAAPPALGVGDSTLGSHSGTIYRVRTSWRDLTASQQQFQALSEGSSYTFTIDNNGRIVAFAPAEAQ